MAQQYQVDIVTKVSGYQNVQKLEKALAGLANDQKKVDQAASRAANGIRNYGRNAQSASSQVQRLGRASQAAGTQATGMGKAMGFAVNAFKAFLGFQIGKFFLDAASGIEQTQVQLKTLTGSAQQADVIFNQLLDVAKQSPFSFEELTGAAAKLKAFGVETSNVVETTTQLGKVAAATGQEISGIALAYGQVLAKGRLQGEELLQFQERGIPLAKELQKELGVTGAQFQKMVSAGQISAQQVVDAFTRMTGANGQFNNAFENTANLLTTKLTNLQSSVTLFASAFTNAFGPLIKTLLDGATQAIEGFTKAILLSADAGKLTQEEIRQIQDEARAIAESKVDQPWLNAAEASRIYNEELNKGVRALIDQKLAAGEITNAIYDDIEAHKRKLAEQEKLVKAAQAEAQIKKEISQITTAAAQEESAAINAIQQKLSLAQAILDAERAVNEAKLQQAQTDLDNAQTQQQRIDAANKIFEITIENAKLEYEATMAAAEAELQKAKAAVKTQQVLVEQVKTQVALQRSQDIFNKYQDEAIHQAIMAAAVAQESLGVQEQIFAATKQGANARLEMAINAADTLRQQQMQEQQQQRTNEKIGQGVQQMNQLASAAANAANQVARATGGGGGGGGKKSVSTRNANGVANYRHNGGLFVPSYLISGEGDTQRISTEKFGNVTYEQYKYLAENPTHGLKHYEQMKKQQREEQKKIQYEMQHGPDTYEQSFSKTSSRYRAMQKENPNVNVNYSGTTLSFNGGEYVKKGDVKGIVNSAVGSTLKTLRSSSSARLSSGLR